MLKFVLQIVMAISICGSGFCGDSYVILTDGSAVINVDNDADAERLASEGWRIVSDGEVAAAGMAGYEQYVSPANTVIENGVIHFDITAALPRPSLLDAKMAKKAEIDATTNRIRDRDGLAYAGERFDMRDTAMLKWTGLIAAKDMLPFPMTILTIDDRPFVIADQTALMLFAAAVLSYETSADSPLTTGRALRARVEAAQTVAEVEAVVDARQ